MKRLLLALLLAAACKHSSSASSTSHTETSTVTDSTSSESGAVTTTTTTSEAPGETTTTTEEFAPPEAGTGDRIRTDVPGIPTQASVPPDDRSAAAASVDQDRARGRNIPAHGPLVKRTVTVTKSGGETTQTRQEAMQQARGTTEIHENVKEDATAKAHDESAPAASCVSLGWLYGAIVLVALLGIGYFALKPRKLV